MRVTVPLVTLVRVVGVEDQETVKDWPEVRAPASSKSRAIVLPANVTEGFVAPMTFKFVKAAALVGYGVSS